MYHGYNVLDIPLRYLSICAATYSVVSIDTFARTDANRNLFPGTAELTVRNILLASPNTSVSVWIPPIFFFSFLDTYEAALGRC